MLGIKLQRVRDLASGRAKKLSLEEIRALVEDLNVSADWLATGNGPMFRVAVQETHDELARRMRTINDLGAVVDALPLSALEKIRLKAVLSGDLAQDAAQIAAHLTLSPDEQLLLDRYRSSPQPLKDAALRVLLGGDTSREEATRVRQQINAPVSGGVAGRDLVHKGRKKKNEAGDQQ